jgi:hypothetical protein
VSGLEIDAVVETAVPSRPFPLLSAVDPSFKSQNSHAPVGNTVLLDCAISAASDMADAIIPTYCNEPPVDSPKLNSVNVAVVVLRLTTPHVIAPPGVVITPALTVEAFVNLMMTKTQPAVL